MEKKVIIILMVPFLLFWHWFEPAAKKNREGIEAYHAQKYDEALEQFLTAKGINPDLPQLKNNTAAALYQMKKYKEALEEFSAIDPEKAGIPRADFYYNLGNSLFRAQQYEKALQSYRKSLLENGGDMDAKKNYELTLKKIEDQKQKQKQDQKKDQDKKDQDKDKQDKDKQKQDKKKDDQQKKEQEKQQQQKKEQKKEQKHRDIMRYLNQNEKEQMKAKKRKIAVVKKEKDW
jgi:tetratricopeptide (TPR) repeat protein